ncbi:MAG: hypothetical protein PUG10_10330 [Lachnospiraceae bacterium]|nr:hypothetical protein [Lachnospiraceae bacterium]
MKESKINKRYIGLFLTCVLLAMTVCMTGYGRKKPKDSLHNILESALYDEGLELI